MRPAVAKNASWWCRCLALALVGCWGSAAAEYEPRNGDIVFHTSRSAQSLAIQKATESPYSHMGIVYVEDGRALVFEAVHVAAHGRKGDLAGRDIRQPAAGDGVRAVT